MNPNLPDAGMAKGNQVRTINCSDRTSRKGLMFWHSKMGSAKEADPAHPGLSQQALASGGSQPLFPHQANGASQLLQ